VQAGRREPMEWLVRDGGKRGQGRRSVPDGGQATGPRMALAGSTEPRVAQVWSTGQHVARVEARAIASGPLVARVEARTEASQPGGARSGVTGVEEQDPTKGGRQDR
jgi:hypothetical protein